MRRLSLPLMLFVALIVPNRSFAQVDHRPTPPPSVTAAAVGWQLRSEPVFFAGAFYDPAGATVYFDGNVMRRSGMYLGVPLYEDVTIEPHTVVYLPIGRNLMRPYQRRRDDRLAEWAAASQRTNYARSIIDVDYRPSLGEVCGADRCLAAACCTPTDRAGYGAAAAAATTAPPSLEPGILQSIPAPRSSDGVWIDYEGARWYLDGRAVSYDPARFTPIGNYRGFPVYREGGSAGERIFVTIVSDGPVTPFSRR